MNKEGLVEEQKLATLLVIWRLPDFITSFLAALASGYMIIWMEFVESASIIIPGIILIILSVKLNRNLKFQFNYGTGKVEAITAMCCEIFDIAGLCCIVLFSIRELIKPEEEHHFILTALLLKLVGLVIDLFLLNKQKKLAHEVKSRMFHSAYVGAKKEFVFDIVASLALIFSYVYRKSKWINYFSPILCLIFAIPFFVICFHHLTDAIYELVDLTLDEDTQLKLLKVLSSYYEEYEQLIEVKSRRNGNLLYVDLELMFDEDKSFKEIKKAAENIASGIEKEIGDCKVNIVINSNKT
ncbi:cation transporter [Butyrivibrio sp. WCE2006]|uniref:cation transporter n=1 Tax=Butyrivibrio sp. WCE2006 TaxID=1410611 RepID=UPI0005D25CC6|nr:cation transporter [Butyrivibrio sp. WCE2006]